ncbi:hypothetical protein [Streptosporangium sp. NPDC049644]|uniref:hypothetical protein n=1 Tax=Streptosporangium sp. NPDC049644 TaxID=3155507 RepID=UPI0034420F38
MRSDSERVEHRRRDEVHDCVVPECGTRAVEAFMANEGGHLAGRDRKPGDLVDLCAPHAHDVRQAEHLPREQVAEWVRADMKPDPYEALTDGLEGL